MLSVFFYGVGSSMVEPRIVIPLVAGSSPVLHPNLRKYGWAWLKAAVLKTEGSKGSVGSNPTTSAKVIDIYS